MLSTPGIPAFLNLSDAMEIGNHIGVAQGAVLADVLWKLDDAFFLELQGHQIQCLSHRDSPAHSASSPTAGSLKESSGDMETNIRSEQVTTLRRSAGLPPLIRAMQCL